MATNGPGLLLLPPLLLWGCTPCLPKMDVIPQEIPADGQSQATIITNLVGQCHGESEISTSLGALSAREEITKTRSEYTLTAGNIPGEALIEMDIGDRVLSEKVRFIKPPAIGTQLHLHGPISEGDATHAWHAQQAAKWDIDVLWWTDHDYRYWLDYYRTPEWAPGDTLQTESLDSGTREAWWEPTPATGMVFEPSLDSDFLWNNAPTLLLQTSSDDSLEAMGFSSLSWYSNQRRIFRPLLTDVTVGFSVWIPEDFDAMRHQIRVELPLSRIEPTVVRRLWVLDKDDNPSTLPEGSIVWGVNWTPGERNDITIGLSAFARDNIPEELDLSLRGFVIHVGLKANEEQEFRVGGISIEESLDAEQLLAAQQELLEEEMSGEVTHFLGQEVSYEATELLHFSAFGLDGWADYEGIGFLRTHAREIVTDLKQRGATVSLNHPFGVYVGLEEIADPEGLVIGTCNTLDQANLYGVHLLEVGYAERVLNINAHLDLWDCLTERGHIVTGIGSSDQHVTQELTQYPNRQITWILAAETTEASLAEALVAGRAFFGDPTLPGDGAPFVDLLVPNRAVMGQVLDELDGSTINIQAEVRGIHTQDEIHWVVNGEKVEVVTGLVNGATYLLQVTPKEWTTVRLEVWTRAQVAKFFSNPIYLSTEVVDAPEPRVPNP